MLIPNWAILPQTKSYLRYCDIFIASACIVFNITKFSKNPKIIKILSLRHYWLRRSRPRQPTWRRLHQRPAASQPRPAEDHRDGRGRSSALRHFASTSRQPRLRLKDPEQISRNGIHQARGYRRFEAPGRDAGSRGQNWRVQERQSWNFLLGNSRKVDQGI